MDTSIEEIGRRLKAFRMGLGLTPEDLSRNTGVSRAAIYRYEAGHPPRIEALVRIAEGLGVTLTNLLGVGVEYIASAVSFFERMRQLEENVDQIRVLFGPVSYLLTTDGYDDVLPRMLEESVPCDVPDRERALENIEALVAILRQRKERYRRRHPAVLSLVSAAELQQMLRLGLVGTHRPPKADPEERREAARIEVKNIVRLLRAPPIGVQIGVLIDSMPGASFQIFRRASGAETTETRVAVSPFRLGAFSNVRLGVATVTAAPEAVRLYDEMTDTLWTRSLKGDRAADYIESKICGPEQTGRLASVDTANNSSAPHDAAASGRLLATPR